MLFQGALVAAHEIHLIAQPPPGNGHQLPAFIGQEAVQLGQLFQEFRFLQNALTDLTVVFHGIRRILIGTGQKQRVQLGLGWGNGNDLDDIFLIFPNGGTAADAVVFAHGLPHGKAVEQGGDESGFGHDLSPPSGIRRRGAMGLPGHEPPADPCLPESGCLPVYHNGIVEKKQYFCCCNSQKSVV